MKTNGYLLISLDYELHWGSFDKVPLNQRRKQQLQNTVQLVPQMLQLFAQYQIAATWAVVGMMLHKNSQEWMNHVPTETPDYKNTNLNAYRYFNKLGINDEAIEPYFFSPETVRLITQAPQQELASHTYAHYYCSEEKAFPQQGFLADLQKAQSLHGQLGQSVHSLVLPRNQFEPSYLGLMQQLGIEALRTNPTNWYWNVQKDNLWKRIFRGIDTYNLLSYNKCFALDSIDNQTNFPYLLPASRFYRAWKPKQKLLNNLKLQRILNEMTVAAKQNKYYHLWWHPENFGHHPQQCLQELAILLQHYQNLHQQYQFASVTMQQFSQLITSKNGSCTP